MLLVELLERVRSIVRRHLRDELGRLGRGHRLDYLGAQLLIEVFEDVGRARAGQGHEEIADALPRQRLDDVREIRRVQLFRLRGDVARGFLEHREDIRREQRRHRTVF